jgi:hypothetical protein
VHLMFDDDLRVGATPLFAELARRAITTTKE